MSQDKRKEQVAKFHEKQRNRLLADIERQKHEIELKNAVKIGSDKFVSEQLERESALIKSTVGLVQLEDFQRIRESLDEKGKQQQQEEAAVKKKIKEKKRKQREQGRNKLSFDFGDDEGDNDTGLDDDYTKKSTESNEGSADELLVERKPKRLKKDPNVDTSFLPDAERDEQEQKEREALKRQWEEEQEKIKREPLTITASFYDGSSHRVIVTVLKGDTVGTFLSAAKKHFHSLRGTHTDNLMYIKEDLIIPHTYTFYDFIVNKTRGKSGPLFDFGVSDDVRLIGDARLETTESHAGKIVERSWYERNKHIFPASRWEVFDPNKDYGKFTVSDNKKDKGVPK